MLFNLGSVNLITFLFVFIVLLIYFYLFSTRVFIGWFGTSSSTFAGWGVPSKGSINPLFFHIDWIAWFINAESFSPNNLQLYTYWMTSNGFVYGIRWVITLIRIFSVIGLKSTISFNKVNRKTLFINSWFEIKVIYFL